MNTFVMFPYSFLKIIGYASIVNAILHSMM